MRNKERPSAGATKAPTTTTSVQVAGNERSRSLPGSR